jgi:hypothetical protein
LKKKFKYKDVDYEVIEDSKDKILAEGSFVNNKGENRLVRVCWTKEQLKAVEQLLKP